MKTARAYLITALSVTAILALPLAGAHVPIIPGNNSSIQDATVISNPEKSWVAYGAISSPGGSHYYELSMNTGDNIYAMLIKSTDASSRTFHPELILVGPGIQTSGTLPGGIIIPNGSGYTVIPGVSNSKAEYDPFGADSFYQVSNISVSAPASGKYYLVVTSNSTGNYGLAIGQVEQYTLYEWVTLPFYLVYVYMWLGQPIWLVMAPVGLTLIAGSALIYMNSMRRSHDKSMVSWTGGLAAFLFIGSGFLTIFEMLFNLVRTGPDLSALITALLAAMPLAIGCMVLAASFSDRWSARRRAMIILVAGLLGLFALGGYIMATALSVTASAYLFLIVQKGVQGPRQ